MEINKCVIYDNDAEIGGAISVAATCDDFTLRSTAIVGNSTSSSSDPENIYVASTTSTSLNIVGNLVEDPSSEPHVDLAEPNVDGDASVFVDAPAGDFSLEIIDPSEEDPGNVCLNRGDPGDVDYDGARPDIGVKSYLHRFRRGDADGNGMVEPLVDALFILDWGFQQPGYEVPPCLEAADANGDGVNNYISDALRLLNWSTGQADPPPAPGHEECGPNPDIPYSVGCAVMTEEMFDDLTCDPYEEFE